MTDLRRLILEYRAMEKMDRAVQQTGSVDQTDSIGLTARAMRRREIVQALAELTASADQQFPVQAEKHFRFEFDVGNKLLLLRLEERLTEELATELFKAIRIYSVATDAKAGIWDMSSVTEFSLSSDFIRDLASREPAMPNATSRPRIIVVPKTFVFGLARMFALLGQRRNPLLHVVHTLEEALTTLGVQSPHFEPLE